MAHIRKCTLCGSEYDYCPRCDKTKETFYLKYCSENCKDIALVINKAAFNVITKEEAAEEFAKYDLSKLDSYKEVTREFVKGIVQPVEAPKEEVEEVESKFERKNKRKIVNEI